MFGKCDQVKIRTGAVVHCAISPGVGVWAKTMAKSEKTMARMEMVFLNILEVKSFGWTTCRPEWVDGCWSWQGASTRGRKDATNYDMDVLQTTVKSTVYEYDVVRIEVEGRERCEIRTYNVEARFYCSNQHKSFISYWLSNLRALDVKLLLVVNLAPNDDGESLDYPTLHRHH